MNVPLISIPLIALIVCSGCSSHHPTIFEAQNSVAKYIDSGEYIKDFSEVVDEAREYLADRADDRERDLAIVLDIDETSLSNWPAYRVNGFARIVEGECDLVKGPCGIRAWQALGKSEGLAPMLELVRDAEQLGVKVFFISGRPAELQAVTEQNLRSAGFFYDKVIIYPPGAGKFKSAVAFKAPERRKLEELGYKIVLCIGDQESDLKGGACERGFKLPNPVYQLP